jgi:hypothetical protein
VEAENGMTKWLELDGSFRTTYANTAFGFAHNLHTSSLFGLDTLAEFSERLFAFGGKRDVYNAAAAKEFGAAFSNNGGTGLSAGDAIKSIETLNSWVVLKRIEQDPVYREVVEACLDEIGAVAPELSRPNLMRAEGFIFVTSPNGITPYHIDPQWSFLAQIYGQKTYRIYDVSDPTVIPDAEIDAYYGGETMAAKYRADKDQKCCVFDMKPGDAVNQPLHAPHSAAIGPDSYSISLSIALITKQVASEADLRVANNFLRRHGVEPKPIGAAPVVDELKKLSTRGVDFTKRQAKKLLHKEG